MWATRPCRLTLAAENWQTDKKPVEITITTQTLDGEPQAAAGVLKVYQLKQPEKVVRTSLFQQEPVPFPRAARRASGLNPEAQQPKPDPSNPNSWELGDKVAEEKFQTDKTGTVKKTIKLGPGPFRAVLETKDRFDKPVTALLPIQVLQPDGKTLPIRVPNVVAAPKWTVEPGEEFIALWGTGYDKGRAFIEIAHRGKIVQAFWTPAGATQQVIKQAVTEAHRGGFWLRVTMVREDRGYLSSQYVGVPWSNKDLTVKWEHFTSKLEPGKKETWTAVITGPKSEPERPATAVREKAVAEMVATLYDESLDAYFPHNWMHHFGVFRQDNSNLNAQFENTLKYLHGLHGYWNVAHKDATMTYRSFPYEISANLWGYQFFKGAGRVPLGGLRDQMGEGATDGIPAAPPPVPAAHRAELAATSSADGKDRGGYGGYGAGEPGQPGSASPAGQGPDLSKVSARKNLNETAFFFPHLISDSEGKVKIEFTMPEALTQWKFMGFAHDKALRTGYLQDKAVTAKDLMVQPNPPRFLREGDVLEFTVKVANQSSIRLPGTVRLTLADARTGKSVDELLGNTKLDQSFDIPEKESRSFAWRLTVPDGLGPLTYKAVGSTSQLSDGEEGYLPVLSRRILVTESLPLPIRGPQTKQFEFTKLLKSGESKTLQNQSLTVQMVSNPSWYAVMALPYLMEYPYECSEQIFNRLYANSLARHIANSDPKIQAVFNQWRAEGGNAPGALDSPLEKNQDLKAVMLEETPWLRQANKESQARKNVGILFDNNRLNAETARTLRKLADMQYPDGAWPWFPGGPPNDYITLYITTGFGRLRHLGVKIEMEPAIKSLARLDNWIDRIYHDILKSGTQDLKPSDADDCPVPVRPQLLPGRQAYRQATPGGRRLLPGPGPQVLAAAGQSPVAGAPGPGPEALRRQGHAAGDHEVDQGTLGQQRGTRHVLARPGAVVVVVPRSHRDPGRDDRGLRRGDERPRRPSRSARSGCSSRSRPRTGRPPRRRPTRSTPCCCAARTCWPPTPWSRWSSAARPSSPRRSRPAPASTSSVSSRAKSPPSRARSPSRRWTRASPGAASTGSTWKT